MRRFVLLTTLVFGASALAEELPLNPVVTQATIGETICVQGWTRTVRPPVSRTNRIKRELIRREELPAESLVDFELDHRIPLCLGGAPADLRNFQLQPWDDAEKKDSVEACLCRAVCAGEIKLDEARRRIWADWRHVGADCDGGRQMGWKGQDNRDLDAEREWRALPFRERYNWAFLAVMLAILGAIGAIALVFHSPS